MTGWRALTRFPDDRIEQANRSTGLEALFTDTGLNDVRGRLAAVENRFTFGWLPSLGYGMSGDGRDIVENVSVLTVAGPAALIGLGAVFGSRRSAVAGSSPLPLSGESR